jgi:hypothetical protein
MQNVLLRKTEKKICEGMAIAYFWIRHCQTETTDFFRANLFSVHYMPGQHKKLMQKLFLKKWLDTQGFILL